MQLVIRMGQQSHVPSCSALSRGLMVMQARRASLQERRRKQWQSIEASANRHATKTPLR